MNSNLPTLPRIAPNPALDEDDTYLFSAYLLPVLDETVVHYSQKTGDSRTETFRALAQLGINSLRENDNVFAWAEALPDQDEHAETIQRAIVISVGFSSYLRQVALASGHSKSHVFSHLVSLGLHLAGETPPLPARAPQAA